MCEFPPMKLKNAEKRPSIEILAEDTFALTTLTSVANVLSSEAHSQ
jgi:hypothetical protein